MKGILGEKLEITYYAPAHAVSVFKRCCVRLSVCSRGSARGSINAVHQWAKNVHRRRHIIRGPRKCRSDIKDV